MVTISEEKTLSLIVFVVYMLRRYENGENVVLLVSFVKRYVQLWLLPLIQSLEKPMAKKNEFV